MAIKGRAVNFTMALTKAVDQKWQKNECNITTNIGNSSKNILRRNKVQNNRNSDIGSNIIQDHGKKIIRPNTAYIEERMTVNQIYSKTPTRISVD